jgi:hypothetical protein
MKHSVNASQVLYNKNQDFDQRKKRPSRKISEILDNFLSSWKPKF